MRIIDATRRSAVAVTADRPINQVAQLMEDATVGAVVVVDGDQPVGIVMRNALRVHRILLVRGAMHASEQ